MISYIDFKGECKTCKVERTMYWTAKANVDVQTLSHQILRVRRATTSSISKLIKLRSMIYIPQMLANILV